VASAVSAEPETEPTSGWRSPELERELPDLRLLCVEAVLAPAESPLAASPRGVVARLAALSNGFRGAQAVATRREPVPAAYRTFFRHIGLDPDVVHTPIEAAVLERLVSGGFLSAGLLPDVLLIALIDTGVGVWALDRERVNGTLGLRASHEGEPLGRGRDALPLLGGTLVVADEEGALATLFAQPAAPHRPDANTRRLLLYAIGVEGVPSMYLEEALWSCSTALAGG
jgi:DNA/RNA-binding domain of Phe-tRNA-synthetase-like protein